MDPTARAAATTNDAPEHERRIEDAQVVVVAGRRARDTLGGAADGGWKRRAARMVTRTGRRQTVKWDGENMRFTNNDDANKLVSRSYRAGY